MKLLDRYKISLHNIKNNKSRSILTTIIVYIISLLLTSILSIGISFSTNMNNIIKKYYSEATNVIDLSYFKNEDSIVINNSNYTNLYNVILNHDSTVSYSSHSANLDSYEVYLEDHGYFPSTFIEIVEGNAPTFSDANTNKVLVSAQYADEYYNLTGSILKPNDKIKYSFGVRYYSEQPKYISTELEVLGIYKVKNVSDCPITDNHNLIMDIQYLLSLDNDFYVEYLQYYYDVSKVGFDIDEFSDMVLTLISDLRNQLGENFLSTSIHSSAENDLFLSKIFNSFILEISTNLNILKSLIVFSSVIYSLL